MISVYGKSLSHEDCQKKKSGFVLFYIFVSQNLISPINRTGMWCFICLAMKLLLVLFFPSNFR